MLAYKPVPLKAVPQRICRAFVHCLQGLKRGCIASPVIFSLLVNELTNEIFAKAKRGIPVGPTDIELFLLLFADGLTLLVSTVTGLQNQLNVLSVAAERCLTVNLDKSKVVVFRKGAFLAAKGKWFLGGAVLEVVNNYKYLGLTFPTGHKFTAAMEDMSIKRLSVINRKYILSFLMHRLYLCCCMLQKSGLQKL